MPAHTYQIAICEEGRWLREYVCAEDRVQAVYNFIESNPQWTIEFLLQADEFEVEACA